MSLAIFISLASLSFIISLKMSIPAFTLQPRVFTLHKHIKNDRAPLFNGNRRVIYACFFLCLCPCLVFVVTFPLALKSLYLCDFVFMKLPTFADPESLSYVYTLLQSSFDQTNENDTTKKRDRKNNDDDDDEGPSNNNNQDEEERTNKKKKKNKKELKGILTSLLLVEEQEKLDQQHFNEVSKEEKKSSDTNHKKKTKTMLQYYSNMDGYYNQVQESEHVKRKKTRSMASAVTAAAVAAASEEGFDSKACTEGAPHRRLWVKDRSGAWWDECNRFDFPEDEFRKAFRMGRSTFDLICEELNSAIVKEDTTLRNAIPVRQRVAVCLWRLATGDPLRVVSKRFGLGISTCHKLVLEVCTAIKTVLMPKYLQWPDEATLRKIKGEFESISGIPNVVGSMYTSHVPIIAPKVSVAAYFNKRHTERNKKTCYSITVQGVVDPRGVFTDVCIGWPGSMPDDQVLEKSALNQRANNGGLLKGVWIVGGSSYPLMDWVLVPFTQKNLTWTQHGFNEKIGEVQMVAKDAFARLKGRWCCLQKRTEVKLQDLPLVLGACCVLHNICELKGEKLDPELKFDLVDDEMVPEVALRSVNSMNARDAIAHNLLHHGLAGTSFV